MSLTYPQVPSDCHSLLRLCRELKQFKLPKQVWVGAHVVVATGEEALLRSQNISLRLKSDDGLHLKEGESWALLLLSEGIELVNDHELVASKAPLEAVRLTPSEKPLASPVDTKPLCLWSGFLQEVRSHFAEEGLQEVFTPSLVSCPGMEPQLEPFVTEFQMGKTRQHFFLPTSPELHLKKMLAQGWSDIFEIKNCFRNGELAPHHEPEFWMLEWYRAYATLEIIEKDLRQLLQHLHRKGWVKGELPELEVVTVAGLFAEHVGHRLTPQTTLSELEGWCVEHGLRLSGDDSWDDLFFLLFLTQVEPHFNIDPSHNRMLIVKDYPPSQAALARINSDGWGERFEFYWGGIEVANAFHELNDPAIQRQRFEEDIRQRKRLGRIPLEIDEEFMSALESGMPPSGGIALGIERLFMACQKMNDLKQLRPFSMRHHH